MKMEQEETIAAVKATLGTSMKGGEHPTRHLIFSSHHTLSRTFLSAGGPIALISRLSSAPAPPPAVARIVEHVMASMRDGKGLGNMSVIEEIKVCAIAVNWRKLCFSSFSASKPGPLYTTKYAFMARCCVS
jgi:hypothetical protein